MFNIYSNDTYIIHLLQSNNTPLLSTYVYCSYINFYNSINKQTNIINTHIIDNKISANNVLYICLHICITFIVEYDII